MDDSPRNTAGRAPAEPGNGFQCHAALLLLQNTNNNDTSLRGRRAIKK
jgi:hypothetical protein